MTDLLSTLKASELPAHCLSGDVSYRGRGGPKGLHVCHCRQCARWGGGPALGFEFAEGVDFSGPVKWFSSSDWAERGFCTNCGSTIFYRLKDGSWFNVAAGTLDDQSVLSDIESHIFVDCKPSYYDFADQAPRLTEEQFLATLQSK